MTEQSHRPAFKILDETLVKKYLTNASLLLIGWELLKSVIIDNLKGFLCFNYETINGQLVLIESEEYKREVLSLDKRDRLNASCLYSLKLGIITDDEYAEIRRLREVRNSVAHELLKILHEDDFHIYDSDIHSLNALVEKIEVWWLKNVEIPTDPDLLDMDEDQIDWNGVASGRMLILRYLTGFQIC